MRSLIVLGLAGVIVTLALERPTSAADDAKYNIKEVMKKAHDQRMGIFGKVTRGMASKEEREELVELYTALGQNKPKKGPEKSWTDKTTALVEAAKAVATNEKDRMAVAKLMQAGNCMGCHRIHK